MLYIRMPLIKGPRFLGYKSSSSLQASAFNGDGEVYSRYPRVNTLNLSIKFRREGGINYYKSSL